MKAIVLIILALAFSSPMAMAGPRYAGIVVDAKTGKVLYSEDPDGLRYPASLTKMMTLYMVFEALESGRIKLDTKVPFSAHAASEPPTKLGVGSGRSITVEQGILSLVTLSANDTATAFGEFLGGSESQFARKMTAKARALGMTRTIYRNANGLPNDQQVTTARDQARLGMALRQHFPEYYGYFSTRNFAFGKRVIGNHNRLLGVVKGVDGIKTGFTRAAGYNLVTSAQLDGRSIVGVVMGAKSGGSRNAQMTKLVKAYLPQASTRGKEALIASSKQPAIEPVETAMADTSSTQTDATRSLELPTNGPLPTVRYEKAVSASMASGIEEPVDVQPEQKVAIAVPVPARDVVADAADADASAKVDEVTTASTGSSMSGWVIQIGAAPAKAEAMKLLQNAQDKGGKVLRSATPFTVAFNKDGAQVYRARFGGFSGQDQAVSACKVLKKKGFGCWASQQ